MEVDGIVCVVEILIDCGEEIPAMLENKIKNSDRVVIVYSIFCWSRKSICFKVKDSQIFSFILVVNKMDLEDQRVITKEEGDELSKKGDVDLLNALQKMEIGHWSTLSRSSPTNHEKKEM